MKTIPRRGKLKIYGDLLYALKTEANQRERVMLTHVQVRINVPFDRLKSYIIELKELDFVEDETSRKLTEKRKQYLKEYENILEFMNEWV